MAEIFTTPADGFSPSGSVPARRHGLLERPLTLWNHLDIDFVEELRACIQNRSDVSPPAVDMSADLPLVSSCLAV